MAATTNQASNERLGNSGVSPKAIITFGYGLNENNQPRLDEASAGYNFELKLNRTSLVARPPLDLLGKAPNSGAGCGILQLNQKSGTQTTLIGAGGVLYKWDGTNFVGVGSLTTTAKLKYDYWSAGDYLVITDMNLKNPVSKWDGTTFSTLTTDLTYPLYAKYVISYLNRIWLFNITYNGTNYPNMILVSQYGTPTNYNISLRGGPTGLGGGSFSTGLEAFYILTPNLADISGVSYFSNSLIVSTKNGPIYQLTGTTSQTFQFTDLYDTLPIIGDDAIKVSGNDLVFVTQGGNIQLLSQTPNANANYSVWVNNIGQWLNQSIDNITGVNSFCEDLANRRLFLFLNGKALVLFRDLMPTSSGDVTKSPSPWSVYTTNDPSGFNTQCSAYIQLPGSTNYNLVFVDSTGRILNTNGTGNNDGGVYPVNVSRTTAHIGAENINPWPYEKQNPIMKLHYRRELTTNCSVSLIWDDEFSTTTASMNLKGPYAGEAGSYYSGPVYYSGAYYYNQGAAYAGLISCKNFTPGGKGPGFYMTFYSSVGQPIEITQIDLD